MDGRISEHYIKDSGTHFAEHLLVKGTENHHEYMFVSFTDPRERTFFRAISEAYRIHKRQERILTHKSGLQESALRLGVRN